MQKKKWVRVGLAAVIVGGAFGGISAAGCSGDDSSGTPGKGDAGKSDSSIPSGEGGADSMTPGDTGTTPDGSDASKPPPNAIVYLLHAAADPKATPLRFCFGLNPTDAGTATVAGGIDPFPDYVTIPGAPVAGLFPGFGGSTASSPKLATFDLSTLTIALYAIDATQIGNNTADGGPDGGAEVPCEGLIGNDALGKGATSPGNGGTLTLNSQFWYLGTIPKGTLNHGQTWVAAVTGCFAGEDAQEAAFCPSSPPYNMNTGNLSLKAWQLDNTTPVAADGGIGAQFASASPSWDTANTLYGGVTGTTAAGFWIETPAVIPDSGTAETGAGDSGDAATDAADTGTVDAGPPGPTLTLIPITGTGTYGSITPKLVTVPVPLNSPAAGFFTSFITADGGAVYFPPGCMPGTGCASPLLLPLPVIDQLTNGTVPTGGSFANGKGYAFVLLGNPLSPVYINPLDGGAATSTTGVYNGKSGHFLGLPTSNP